MNIMETILAPKIHAVLFDLDDTLYDRGFAVQKCAEWFAGALLCLDDSTEYQDIVQLIVSLDANGYGSKQALFTEIKRLYPTTLRQDADDLVNLFYDRLVSFMSLDNITRDLLAMLAKEKIAFGIVTNGSSRQWRKMRHLGLDRLTPCILVSEDFGCKKPDPAIFLAAAACLESVPSEILFVGDHPANDIRGAGRAGMHTAWLHRDRPWPAEISDHLPGFRINTLAELSPILNLV